jgi:hypothetical protein
MLGCVRSWRASALTGCSTGGGWQAWARKGGGGKIKGKTSFFQIFKLTQANEFKQRFEFKHSKQCTSMYATGNTYTSLFH